MVNYLQFERQSIDIKSTLQRLPNQNLPFHSYCDSAKPATLSHVSCVLIFMDGGERLPRQLMAAPCDRTGRDLTFILTALPIEFLSSVFSENSKKCSLVSKNLRGMVQSTASVVIKTATETALCTRSTFAIVKCVNQFNSMEIVHKGCSVLSKVASLYIGFGDEYREISSKDGEEKQKLDREYSRIADEGGVDVVLKAMKSDPNSVSLFIDCCSFLAYIARAKINHLKVKNLNLFSIIANIMELHLASASAQSIGCRALCNLSSSPTLLNDVGAPSALTSILVAMRHHPADPDVQALGCDAVCNFCFRDELHETALARNAVCLVVGAMGRHLQTARVQISGSCALHNLSDGAGHWRVRGEGGVAAARAALAAHPDDGQVQRDVRDLLAILAADPGGA